MPSEPTPAPTDVLPESLERDADRDVAQRFLELAIDYLAATREGSGPVSAPPSPAEIATRFDEPLPSTGRPIAEVIARLERDVISGVNRLAHPMAMGHQVSPPLAVAIWMEPLISALNQSLAVFEMSPTATALEARVIRWMCDLAGFQAGAGGTLTSGGTEATFTALLAARAAALPNAWLDGLEAGGELPVVVCGEHAHYSVTRAIGELGLGMRHAVLIPSREFRMDAHVLERRLAELAHAKTSVMAVVATAGSTATGSFDDLDTIAGLCAEHGIWLHVDGAHGASALFSMAHRHRLRGLEHARSVAWDPHKMMLMPLPAGMLLVRDERDLEGAFSQRAPYLFHGTDVGRIWDQGVRSFQCSRRADVLKLWVALQSYGASGFGAIYDQLCATARFLWEEISERGDFEALHEPESNILCFRYVGDRARGDERLDALNRALREQYNASGRGWITSTVLGGRRVLRVTIMNPRTGAGHVADLLEGLGQVARTLAT